MAKNNKASTGIMKWILLACCGGVLSVGLGRTPTGDPTVDAAWGVIEETSSLLHVTGTFSEDLAKIENGRITEEDLRRWKREADEWSRGDVWRQRADAGDKTSELKRSNAIVLVNSYYEKIAKHKFIDSRRPSQQGQVRDAWDLCYYLNTVYGGQLPDAGGKDSGEAHDTSRQSDRPQSVNCEADRKTEGQSSDWSFPMWLKALALVGVGVLLARLFK